MPDEARSTGAASARTDALWDLAGLLVFTALLGWVALAGRGAGASAGPLTAALVGLAVAYVAGRTVSAVHDWAVPAAVAVAALGLALWRFDVLFSGPLSSPLGYANATGAFYVQAAAAAVMVAVRAPEDTVRQAGLGLAIAFAAVPWINGTDTAAVLVLALGLVGAVVTGSLRVRTVLVGAVTATVAVLVATTVIGATYQPDRDAFIDRAVEATLSERRAQLWHDALVLLRDHPVTGVGAGRFDQESPTALEDADAAWAHHELLHLGAETGAPGMVLGLALLAYAFAVLWRGPRDAATAAAGLALAAVTIHASVDYVLHFPAVGIAAAAIAGAGPARGRPPPAPSRPPPETSRDAPAGA